MIYRRDKRGKQTDFSQGTCPTPQMYPWGTADILFALPAFRDDQ